MVLYTETEFTSKSDRPEALININTDKTIYERQIQKNNMIIKEASQCSFIFDGQTHILHPKIVIQLFSSSDVLKSSIIYNSKKCNPLVLEIIDKTAMIIYDLSITDRFGEEDDQTFSRYVVEDLSLACRLVQRILKEGQWLFIHIDNVNNIVEIGVMTDVIHKNRRNEQVGNTKNVITVLQYNFKRNNLPIIRHNVNLYSNIKNPEFINILEYPFSIDEALVTHFNYEKGVISLMEICDMNISKTVYSYTL